MQACNNSIRAPNIIRKSVKKASINAILRQRMIAGTTCFAMNPPHGFSRTQQWFKHKPWVSDTLTSKILAQFRLCNAGLGNRAPAADGNFYKLRPLCKRKGIFALNNEVHMVIDCPELACHRKICGLGPFISIHRAMNPHISSLKLYALFLDDSHNEKLQKRAIDLYSMKMAWCNLTKISLKL